MKTAVRQSLVDIAASSIRSELQSGRWRPGDRLPNETQLCDMLVVSRGTLREAVRVLVAEELLETRQGAGTFVRLPPQGEQNLLRLRKTGLRDQFEARALLEAEAARLAALRATPETIAGLRTLLERRDRRGPDDRNDFIANDFAFHEAIVAAAGNRALMEIYAFFSASIRASIAASLEDSLPEPDNAQHAAIVDAIAAGDSELASATVRRFMAPLIDELERQLASS